MKIRSNLLKYHQSKYQIYEFITFLLNREIPYVIGSIMLLISYLQLGLLLTHTIILHNIKISNLDIIYRYLKSIFLIKDLDTNEENLTITSDSDYKFSYVILAYLCITIISGIYAYIFNSKSIKSFSAFNIILIEYVALVPFTIFSINLCLNFYNENIVYIAAVNLSITLLIFTFSMLLTPISNITKNCFFTKLRNTYSIAYYILRIFSVIIYIIVFHNKSLNFLCYLIFCFFFILYIYMTFNQIQNFTSKEFIITNFAGILIILERILFILSFEYYFTYCSKDNLVLYFFCDNSNNSHSIFNADNSTYNVIEMSLHIRFYENYFLFIAFIILGYIFLIRNFCNFLFFFALNHDFNSFQYSSDYIVKYLYSLRMILKQSIIRDEYSILKGIFHSFNIFKKLNSEIFSDKLFKKINHINDENIMYQNMIDQIFFFYNSKYSNCLDFNISYLYFTIVEIKNYPKGSYLIENLSLNNSKQFTTAIISFSLNSEILEGIIHEENLYYSILQKNIDKIILSKQILKVDNFELKSSKNDHISQWNPVIFYEVLLYNKTLEKFIVKFSECIKDKKNLWNKVNNLNIFVDEIQESTTEYFKNKNAIKSIWNELNYISNHNIDLNTTSIYCNFLRFICDDEINSEIIYNNSFRITNSFTIDKLFDSKFHQETGIVMLNLSYKNIGIITYINSALSKLLEYKSNKELEGRNINSIQPHFMSEIHDTILKDYIFRGKSRIFNKTLNFLHAKTKNNYLIPVNLSVSILPNINEKTQVCGIMKKIEEKNEYIVFDINGKIDGTSTYIADVLNIKPDYLIKEDYYIYNYLPKLIQPNFRNTPYAYEKDTLTLKKSDFKMNLYYPDTNRNFSSINHNLFKRNDSNTDNNLEANAISKFKNTLNPYKSIVKKLAKRNKGLFTETEGLKPLIENCMFHYLSQKINTQLVVNINDILKNVINNFKPFQYKSKEISFFLYSYKASNVDNFYYRVIEIKRSQLNFNDKYNLTRIDTNTDCETINDRKNKKKDQFEIDTINNGSSQAFDTASSSVTKSKVDFEDRLQKLKDYNYEVNYKLKFLAVIITILMISIIVINYILMIYLIYIQDFRLKYNHNISMIANFMFKSKEHFSQLISYTFDFGLNIVNENIIKIIYDKYNTYVSEILQNLNKYIEIIIDLDKDMAIYTIFVSNNQNSIFLNSKNYHSIDELLTHHIGKISKFLASVFNTITLDNSTLYYRNFLRFVDLNSILNEPYTIFEFGLYFSSLLNNYFTISFQKILIITGSLNLFFVIVISGILIYFYFIFSYKNLKKSKIFFIFDYIKDIELNYLLIELENFEIKFGSLLNNKIENYKRKNIDDNDENNLSNNVEINTYRNSEDNVNIAETKNEIEEEKSKLIENDNKNHFFEKVKQYSSNNLIRSKFNTNKILIKTSLDIKANSKNERKIFNNNTIVKKYYNNAFFIVFMIFFVIGISSIFITIISLRIENYNNFFDISNKMLNLLYAKKQIYDFNVPSQNKNLQIDTKIIDFKEFNSIIDEVRFEYFKIIQKQINYHENITNLIQETNICSEDTQKLINESFLNYNKTNNINIPFNTDICKEVAFDKFLKHGLQTSFKFYTDNLFEDVIKNQYSYKIEDLNNKNFIFLLLQYIESMLIYVNLEISNHYSLKTILIRNSHFIIVFIEILLVTISLILITLRFLKFLKVEDSFSIDLIEEFPKKIQRNNEKVRNELKYIIENIE